ncbi:MAG TPA: flagellar hook-basal body complex protein FliE [Aquimonas sp.]|jgi:flagellar hook-basal body complex protein FliE|nr:flagellar hook-basal body complex protein FliE [Xanthomonadales bacterium]HRD71880.1 flagellar hook-basal body complex protein FliE [Aquimonas sp.]HRF55051.1 flagellar hook-basal body complex protein FliE [Aquimonas sp.]
MSDATISSILSQIRNLQGQSTALRPSAAESAPVAAESSFGATFKKALNQVNTQQQESATLARGFEMGDPNIDLVRVMLAQQEAAVSFRATVEVRNRLVQAYQDVMNMPL